MKPASVSKKTGEQPEIFAQSEEVEVGAIEQALNRLWMRLAETKDAGLADPVMRACVLNLLIYAEGAAETDLASHLIADIGDHTPCRIIFMEADREATDQKLAAQVTALCAVSPGSSKQVCCEQITLRAQGEMAISQLPSTVLGLLVPDIPVTLWWVGNPAFGQDLFDDLAYAAGRTILDSAYFDPTQISLPRLWQALRNRHAFTAFCDLSWSRLQPWRELLAQFFDPPAMRPHLKQIEQVEVVYEAEAGGQEVNPNQALLLVGWLAARAGWATVPGLRQMLDDTVRYVLAKPNGWVIVTLTARHRPAKGRRRGAAQDQPAQEEAPGNIAAVHLSATASPDGSLPQAAFRILREVDDDCAITLVEKDGAAPLSRVARMVSLSLDKLLGAELQRLGRDGVFEESLAIAARLMER